MWDTIRNLTTTVKDALGIETPESPIDLGSAGEGVESVTQTASDAIAGATTGLDDAVTSIGETASGAVTDAGTGLSETAADAGDAITRIDPTE